MGHDNFVETIIARITREQQAYLIDMAIKANTTISEVIRDMIDQSIKKEN